LENPTVKTLLITSLAGFSLLVASHAAHAQGLDSCGDIHVEAEAMCELVPPGAQCEARCTPISVEAACAAKLQVECEGECSATASVDCSGQCYADCTGPCEIDPGKFDCRAQCQADCSASCSGKCSGDNNGAECEGACQATCDANCDASCDVELPEVDCDRKCEAACEGSCEAEAEADCQIMCQGDAYADCEFEVQGGCEAECKTQEGALFCDGSYVDHGDNLEECVNAIEAVINANVKGYAEGESSCENGSCMASGKAGVSCSALPGTRESGAAALSLLALVGLVLARRRR
jgi:hypothetical protein